MKSGVKEVEKLGREINELGGQLETPERDSTFPVRQTLVKFPNGYGISFIKGLGTYGLEAGIIRHHDGEWHLCYDTPITDDVIGHLKEDDIIPLCKRVSELDEVESG